METALYEIIDMWKLRLTHARYTYNLKFVIALPIVYTHVVLGVTSKQLHDKFYNVMGANNQNNFIARLGNASLPLLLLLY